MSLRLAALVTSAVLLPGLGCRMDPHAPVSDVVATYTGGSTCVTCHADQAARWRGSHHDLAMQAATPGTVLGDFDEATFTYAGVTSTFFRRDSTFFVRTDGPGGALQDYPVAYTFGVTPLQQYLIALPGGRYQALTIAWDSRPRDAGGQRWFHLYPGEAVTHDDPLHWTGRYLNWNYMCADCHSTDLAKNYDLESDRYATTWTDLDVSCEACHGPGSTHVAWAEARTAGTETDAYTDDGLTVHLTDRDGGTWVMDPATGIARRNVPRAAPTLVETCAPCHARRTVLADDYRPGQPLLNAYRPVLLDEGLYHADGQIQDEVYVYGSFVQSKMYRAGVTCSDCHDAHSLALKTEGNALCAPCHQPAVFDTPAHHFHEPASDGARCVACHMPAQTYMVVDPRRDHSLRVPRPDLSETLGTPNACNACHADRSAAWAATAAATWYGPPDSSASHYGEALHAGRVGAPGADEALARLVDDLEQPGIARATALSLLRSNAGSSTLQAVRRGLVDADPLVRYAALHTLDVAPPETRAALALPLLSDSIRAVRLEAARVLAPVPSRSLTTDQQARLDRAIEAYVAAEQVNADRPDAHMNLALLYTGRGRPEDAEAAYHTALRLDSAYVPAYVNLADLYRLLGREADSERTLRTGLAQAPEAAELYHALGLLLVRNDRLQEAVDALGRAATLQPENARFSYVYGVALHTTGAKTRAFAVLEDAARRHPNDRDLLTALATMHRDDGSPDVALRYARALATLAPGDPAVQQLITQLETETRAE